MRPLLAMLAAVNPAAVALVLWPRERVAAVFSEDKVVGALLDAYAAADRRTA